MHLTDRYRIVQTRLGRDLRGYLSDARCAGRSYRQIAADIEASTGVAVTYEAVRQWVNRLDREAAA